MSASFSESTTDDIGSIGMKSTVPAIVVFRPSVGKRLMVRIPDSPAASFFQLSVLPAPREVTTPMPVTTTIGRPSFSRIVLISLHDSDADGLADGVNTVGVGFHTQRQSIEPLRWSRFVYYAFAVRICVAACSRKGQNAAFAGPEEE